MPLDEGPHHLCCSRNRFAPLEIEEPEGEEPDFADEPVQRARAARSRRGPRTPREVRDSRSADIMRPVPMRGRTRNPKVMEAHARFLQIIFRRSRALAEARARRLAAEMLPREPDARPPSAWRRGCMRGLLPVLRPVHRARCMGGFGLAAPEEFVEQKQRSSRVLAWYRQYVELLRKLLGRTPEVVDLFCGEGGVSEGARRAGLGVFGIDSKEQPNYARRFGSERFLADDAYTPQAVAEAIRRSRAVGVGASPPCQPYSTVLADSSLASAAPGIGQAAEVLRSTGLPFWLENVLGADAGELPEQMTVLRGPMFGLPVDRGRRFWTSYPLHLDEALSEGGSRLRHRCCLGPRRRWMRLDPLGRPVRAPCCRGNLYPVQGSAPVRSSVPENAIAMGVDSGHMSWGGLTQSIPPPMAQLVTSQLAMHVANARFGAPVITFDQMLARPRWAKSTLARWLRGTGSDRVDAGSDLVERSTPVAPAVEVEAPLDERWSPPPEAGAPVPAIAPDSLPRASWDCVDWSIPEAAWREIYYSHVGGFSQCVLEPGAPWWLAAMHHRQPRAPEEVDQAWLEGQNTYMLCSPARLAARWAEIESALASDDRGTRVTIVLPTGLPAGETAWRERLSRAGLSRRDLGEMGLASGDLTVSRGLEGVERALLPSGFEVWSGGKRRFPCAGATLDHDRAEEYMDPRDLGIGCEAKVKKAQRSYGYIPHDPSRWKGKGFSPYVEAVMTEGHRIEGPEPFGFYEVEQYKWRDADAQRMGGLEADRHVLAGALEYVPVSEAQALLSSAATVHPWTVVFQKDKWRACQDYSTGTNMEADSAPFKLPTVFDVRNIIKKSSHFSKWDLRDGFFHVPIHPASRNRMLVRHPVSGLLMRCLRLPFGYVDSPRCFCAVTEAVAQRFRERVARAGIAAHIFVFVDDALVVGDTEADTRAAGRVLEALLAELGLQWAPHKRRGPAQVIEFLGMLLCNAPEGTRAIGLTRARQEALRTRLDDWLAWRPREGGTRRITDPRDLAVLLGHLVFASGVMPNARTYMQGMLASFAGLEVDWRRGKVRAKRGEWRPMELSPSFWRDLEWWDEMLERANCVPIDPPPLASAAVQAGTDASDWGAGEIIYLHGQREETRIRFTSAEKRRPINWRELLGILRIVEVWGPRLRGLRLLVETDNMVARATGAKGHSKAAEMQELLRRLCEACARFEIVLSLTHQPGLKLDRPDQISRGASMEEPRIRLSGPAFEPWEARFGPFTEFLGAERDHAAGDLPLDDRARLFVHPSFSTVGSALRMVGERMREAMDGNTSGLVVVPWAPEALWWKMMRYFSVVAHLSPGLHHPMLEANTLGSWRPLAAARPSLIAAFPRSSGSQARPVHVTSFSSSPPSAGYEEVPMEGKAREGEHKYALVLPKGTFVYSTPETGEFGGLYLLTETYRPTTADEAYGPKGAYVLLDARPAAARECPGRKPVLIDSKDSFTKARGAKERTPHQPLGDELFTVTHLVERVEVPKRTARGWEQVTDYFYFDAQRAAAEIARARDASLAHLADEPRSLADSVLSVLSWDEVMAHEEADDSDEDTVVPPEEPTCEQCSKSRRAVGELIRCNDGCTKMLCSECYPPICHDPCRGAQPLGPTPGVSQTLAKEIEMARGAEGSPILPDSPTPLAARFVMHAHNLFAMHRHLQGEQPWRESDLDEAEVALHELLQPGAASRLISAVAPAAEAFSRDYAVQQAELITPGSPYAILVRELAEVARASTAMPGEPIADRRAHVEREIERRLTAMRAAAEARASAHGHPVSKPQAARICSFPGCTKEAFVEPNGRAHEHCGRTHAAAAAAATALDRRPSGDGAKQIAKSTGMACLGCGGAIREGSKAEVVLNGFCHPVAACRAMALHGVAKSQGAVIAQSTAMAGSLQKQTKLLERFAPERMRNLRRCMDGACGVGADEPAIHCLGGCGRKLHACCSMLNKGNFMKGQFRCVSCRLLEMQAEGDADEITLNEMAADCLLELSTGREGTSANHEAFVRLTEQWVAEKKAHGLRKILSPTENMESFRSFLSWMVLTADRARSLETTWRSAGGYFEGTSKRNFTKDKGVIALHKTLADLHGHTSQPMTQGTRRMVQMILFDILPRRFGKLPYIRLRDQVNTIAEAVGCLRSSESCNAIQSHGLAANSCFILSDLTTGEVSVEVKVHDTKTKMDRYVNMCGTTLTSKIPVAATFMELFRANQLTLVHGREGGFDFVQPDSWGVKLSLLHFEPATWPEKLVKLRAVLDEVMTSYTLAWRKRMVKYADQAFKAGSMGEAHKYVLLNEGAQASAEHYRLMSALQAAGLGSVGSTLNLVPAPLLRATDGGGVQLMPMPYTYKAAYDMTKGLFEEAFKRCNELGNPDPELDLQGHAEAKFGQYSWRRFGEKIARDSSDHHQMDHVQVDLYSGWDQHEHSMDMQIHYAGQQRSHRVKRRKITEMM